MDSRKRHTVLSEAAGATPPEIIMINEILVETDKIIEEVKANLEKLTPHEVSDATIKLSANLATIGESLVKAEQAYFTEWERIRMAVDTDGRTNRKAKITVQYFTMRLYEVKYAAVKEIVMALKKRLTMLLDEMARGL